MAAADSPWWLLVAVLALAGLATFAYAVRALDLLGSVASFLLGLLVAVLGGVGWMLLMVLFTALGSAATRVGAARKKARKVQEPQEGERGVRNVLGNGAAAGLMVLTLLVPAVPGVAARLAFATAVCAVAADTLASEVGVLARRARSILPPFRAVHVGANGGVSWPGQGAAALGSLAVAAASVPFVGVPVAWCWVPAAAGFLGCQIDSLLGAALEGEASRPGPLGKQDVNFLSSLIPSAAVMALAAWLA